MTMFRLLMMLFLGMSGLSSAYAGCSSSSSSSSFGSISSFTLASTAQTVESGSGFTCSGSLLSLISTNTVTATISSTSNASGSTPQLYNASTGEYIPYAICKDSGCSATYPIGDTIKWSSTTLLGLLGLFNSSDGTLPIYLRTSTGANVAAGTYTDNITLSWYYKICFVGVLGICAYTTGTDTSVVPVSMVEISDVIFAVDSIPAIFAVTTDPFIVLTSNLFAILGLRAMYFLLSGVAEKFSLLKYGLAVILIFIGVKMMLIDLFHIPVSLSLGIVAAILLVTILINIWVNRRAAR